MPVYDGFVTAFVSNNFQLLFEALEGGTSVLTDDHFLGLVSHLSLQHVLLQMRHVVAFRSGNW